jgi:hypothetical protein
MRILLLVLFIFNFIYSQKNNLVQSTPCEHPLILLAEEKGIKAIPIRDLMKFKKIVEDCERLGDKEKIERMIYNDWQRDYEKAKKMQSWSSTHAMCVFVSFAYYFVGQVIATKPGE